MLTLHRTRTADQAFAAAGFIADWILAHGDDDLGRRARLTAKMILLDENDKLVGVVTIIRNRRTLLLCDTVAI